MHLWEDSFEELRSQILTSNDGKKDNYSKSNFQLREQQEVTLLIENEKISAFSTLFYRNHFPPGISRALNRYWRNDSHRKYESPYTPMTRIMLDHQLKVAREIGIKGIIVTTEGMRRKWMKRWVQIAQEIEPEWRLLDGFFQVTAGNSLGSWQNIAFLPLTYGARLELPKMTIDEWKRKRTET